MANTDEPISADEPEGIAAGLPQGDEPEVVIARPASVVAGPRRTAHLQVADHSGDGVGVTWDGTTLHVARVRAAVGQLPTLVSTRAVPVSPGDAEQGGNDPLQLPRVLREVCGDRLRAQVWTTLDSPATLTQIIRVPQVQDSLLPNVALWTLRKGKNVEIEGSVLDFEVLRTVEQDGARQLELFAVAAPRTEIDEVVAEFRAIDYPLSGVVVRRRAHSCKEV